MVSDEEIARLRARVSDLEAKLERLDELEAHRERMEEEYEERIHRAVRAAYKVAANKAVDWVNGDVSAPWASVWGVIVRLPTDAAINMSKTIKCRKRKSK